MTYDTFLKIHTACAKAWYEHKAKPGSFDLSFGDLKQAIAEAKTQADLAGDPRCVAMFEWFEMVEQCLREERRVRDVNQRRADRRGLQRFIKETGDIRIVEGGDCSGNSR